MGRYLIRRIILSIISLFGLASGTFFLLHLLPGGPFDDDTQLAPQVLASLKEYYGLNHSVLQQYFIFIKNIFSFDFGHSILYSGKPVFSVVMLALPRTFSIGGLALLCAAVLGIGIGFLFFITGSQLIVRIIHFIFLSAPTLFLGPSLIFIFGLWMNWLPIAVSESALSYLLPLIVLTIRPTANMARLLIGSLEETLMQPWVITAEAYGFPKNKILMKYAFKQSLIPVLSYLGHSVAGVLSGSVLIEMIFNIQGLGSQFIESLVNRDYSLVVALTIVYGFVLIASSLVFDILIFSLDPRMEKN